MILNENECHWALLNLLETLPGFYYVYIKSNNNKGKNTIWFYWADVHNKDTFDGRKKTLSLPQNSIESLKIKMHS